MADDLVPVEEIDAEIGTIKGMMADSRGAYWTDTALQARYLSLLEARESGAGVPPAPSAADRRLGEIRGMMKDSRGAYWKTPELQNEYRLLLERQEEAERPATAGGDIESARANAVALGAPDWAKSPTFAREAEAGERARAAIMDASGESPALKSAFDGLPGKVRAAAYRELGSPYTPRCAAADGKTLQNFLAKGEGKILGSEWGNDAAMKLGRAFARWNRAFGSLSDADYRTVDEFWRHRISTTDRAAILRQLAL